MNSKYLIEKLTPYITFYFQGCREVAFFFAYICKRIFLKPSKMTELNELISKIVKFRDDRDWAQFHNPKDLAIALNIEAAELLELFLWKNENEANRERFKEELADVLIYALLLAEKFDLDVEKIIEDKLIHNSQKYPVDKAKGNAKKYSEL